MITVALSYTPSMMNSFKAASLGARKVEVPERVKIMSLLGDDLLASWGHQPKRLVSFPFGKFGERTSK